MYLLFLRLHLPKKQDHEMINPRYPNEKDYFFSNCQYFKKSKFRE